MVPEGHFILQWIREAGREQQVMFLSEGEIETEIRSDWAGRRIHPGGPSRLQIDQKRRLVLREAGGVMTELGSFCGPRDGLRVQRVNETPARHSCFLLNGNGFEDQLRRGIQERLRNRVVREHGAWNVMVAPYDALHAAGIILESIEPIEITADVNANRTQDFQNTPRPDSIIRNREARQVRFEDRDWQIEGATWNGDWHDSLHGNYILQVRWAPPQGTLGWHRVTRFVQSATEQGGTVGRVTYREHRLGASVFWAEADNGRHRYISAFDMQENPPMYFLAQLPDGPEVTDYDTAIQALAPPMVHHAASTGRETQRHGDIFLVRTNETDDGLRGRGKIYERRSTGMRVLVRGGAGGGSRWTALPPSVKHNRRVRIFDTGHTADRVCKTTDGCTFVQGLVRHEPHLVPGEEDRRPDHADLRLSRGVWYLCVRNTVPAA